VSRRGAWNPVAAGLVLLFIVGCHAPAVVDFQQTGTILLVDDERAGRVFSSYLDLVDSRSALRGTARVLVEGPDFKLNRPQRIVVERPSSIRLEVIGLFDQPAAMLATDGRQFGFYQASNGQISRGHVTPTLLWDLAKIDLEIPEIVGLLLGAPMPSRGLARAAVWLEAEGGLVLAFAWPDPEPAAECSHALRAGLFESDCFATLASLENGGEIFLFDIDGRLAEVRGIDPGGVIRFRATFEDYRPLDADNADADAGEGDEPMMFPNQITIRSSAAESLARFVWRRVMLADELSGRLFMIPERDDAREDG
jgi:hypothetical protein